MRIIPKTAKVKSEFFKNISVADIIIGLIGLTLAVLLLLTNMGYLRFVLITILITVFVGLYIPFDGQRFYLMFVNMIKYVFSVKRFTTDYVSASSYVQNFLAFKNVKDGFIEFENYYAGVLQIDPREFRLLTGFRQDQIIDQCFGKLVRSIAGKTSASIVKIDRKLVMDDYIRAEELKKETLKKIRELGDITDDELNARLNVIDDRIATYTAFNTTNRIKKPFYYFVVYDSEKSVINEIISSGIDSLLDAGMTSEKLDDRNLCIFLKYNFTDDFEETDYDVLRPEEIMPWIVPKEIRFFSKSTVVDGVETFNFTVRNYPLYVLNAWGYQLFNIENTKVVMNIEAYEKNKAVRMIDRSLQELLSQSEQSYKASSVISKTTHIETLVNLLQMLQNDNESLFKVTLHVTVFNRNANETSKNIKKTIKRVLVEQGFELSDNYFKQNRAFVSSAVSAFDSMTEYCRAIHSSTVAAVFPFVLSTLMDAGGIILGQSKNFPVTVDFFKRDNERVNSNMVILGKSGSGKSYATKTMLTHLACENSKIFILDPENEYASLTKSLGGKMIDVGTASEGRINPFHIITTLDADEDGDRGKVNNFGVHLQFLEEFFRVVLQGLDVEAQEYLNNLIVELYKSKNITSKTNLSRLNADDYPIFEDLFALINDNLKNAKSDYDIENLRTLLNHISKFAGDGRNSSLWNGISTLSVKENFTVFNFQSLLANKNGVIANAQMLLVLKWLDNEIIKNRDFNLKHGLKRKIVVAVDEAHVFIDPKHPIALDFMYQLAKRIRKYNGMQIVITQNIKDFVGSQDIIRKSTAIINACQYSFIFALAPNDMDDLCTLYDKAGQINSVEQDQIINNDRGNAFIITGPASRTSIEILASNKTRALFGE